MTYLFFSDGNTFVEEVLHHVEETRICRKTKTKERKKTIIMNETIEIDRVVPIIIIVLRAPVFLRLVFYRHRRYYVKRSEYAVE